MTALAPVTGLGIPPRSIIPSAFAEPETAPERADRPPVPGIPEVMG